MSIIVVVRKAGRAVIAADTQASDGSLTLDAAHLANHDKLVPFGDSVLGFAGWSASQEIMESIVRRRPELLDVSSRHALAEAAFKLHAVLKEDYFIDTQEDKDQPVESSQLSMLVASPNGIFELESYRAVSEYTRFWAIGSGRPIAIGAMHAAYAVYDDPLSIARAGIEAACAFDDGCMMPMTYHTVVLATGE
ncbi:MAG: MFS transporter [Pseudomonadota bacterium]